MQQESGATFVQYGVVNRVGGSLVLFKKNSKLSSERKLAECSYKMASVFVFIIVVIIITGTLATASKLAMHHISTCDQCGRPQKGKTGSWCELPPNCTAFEFDDNHLEGPPLSAVGCDKLPSCGRATSLHGGKVAVTYCLKGGYNLFAATDSSVPPPSNCPAPAPPPKIVPPIWHLPARCEEGDVNALFQVWGNVCAQFLPLSLQYKVGTFLLQLLGTHRYVRRVICLIMGLILCRFQCPCSGKANGI